MTFAFDVRGKLKGALAFVHHEAAGGLVLMLAALAALIASNSPLAWLYDGFLDTRRGGARRTAGDRQAAAALDQRRPDGRVLLPGRAGDQARAPARRAFHARPGGAARAGGGGRHGRAGRHLRGHQRRRPGGAERMGHPDRHRHRLLGRRAGVAGLAHSLLAQDLPAGARHHRRPRRHHHHRAVLHGAALAGLAGAGGRRRRRSCGRSMRAA